MEEDEFDFDEDIEEEIRGMQRIANAIFEKIAKEKLNAKKPFTYGFSIRIEGENRKLKEKKEELLEPINKKEPLTDVIEGERKVSITAEIPEVEKKEDINIETTENTLKISVDTPRIKYYKEIPLPCKINQDTANATYKNGILDIEFEKVKEKKRKKLNIN